MTRPRRGLRPGALADLLARPGPAPAAYFNPQEIPMSDKQDGRYERRLEDMVAAKLRGPRAVPGSAQADMAAFSQGEARGEARAPKPDPRDPQESTFEPLADDPKDSGDHAFVLKLCLLAIGGAVAVVSIVHLVAKHAGH